MQLKSQLLTISNKLDVSLTRLERFSRENRQLVKWCDQLKVKNLHGEEVNRSIEFKRKDLQDQIEKLKFDNNKLKSTIQRTELTVIPNLNNLVTNLQSTCFKQKSKYELLEKRYNKLNSDKNSEIINSRNKINNRLNQVTDLYQKSQQSELNLNNQLKDFKAKLAIEYDNNKQLSSVNNDLY